MCLWVCWKLYINPQFTCIIASSRQELARERSAAIREMLSVNPLTKHLVVLDEQKDPTWRVDRFSVVREQTGDLSPSVSVVPISNLTGSHCDTLLYDDIEVAATCETPTLRKQLRKRFAESFSISRGDMIAVGTSHTEHDSIYPYMRDELGFDTLTQTAYVDGKQPSEEWLDGKFDHPNAYAGELIWPQVISTAEMEKTLLAQGKQMFLSQYLMVNTGVSESVLPYKNLQSYTGSIEVAEFTSNPLSLRPDMFIDGKQIKHIVSFWDPSLGKYSTRDQSVLTVLALTHCGNYYILDSVNLAEADMSAQVPFKRQMQQILDLLIKHRCNNITVESNMIKTLPNQLDEFFQMNGYRVRVTPITRTSGQNKKKLITSVLMPLLSFKKLYISNFTRANSDLVGQLRGHPYGAVDDFIDGLTGAVMALPGHSAKRVDTPLLVPGQENRKKHFEQAAFVLNRYRNR